MRQTDIGDVELGSFYIVICYSYICGFAAERKSLRGKVESMIYVMSRHIHHILIMQYRFALQKPPNFRDVK